MFEASSATSPPSPNAYVSVFHMSVGLVFPPNLIGHYSSFRGPFRILAADQEVPSANFRGTCVSLVASASLPRRMFHKICFREYWRRKESVSLGRNLCRLRFHSATCAAWALACKHRATLPRSFREPSINLPRNPPAVLGFLACCWQLVLVRSNTFLLLL